MKKRKGEAISFFYDNKLAGKNMERGRKRKKSTIKKNGSWEEFQVGENFIHICIRIKLFHRHNLIDHLWPHDIYNNVVGRCFPPSTKRWRKGGRMRRREDLKDMTNLHLLTDRQVAGGKQKKNKEREKEKNNSANIIKT